MREGGRSCALRMVVMGKGSSEEETAWSISGHAG